MRHIRLRRRYHGFKFKHKFKLKKKDKIIIILILIVISIMFIINLISKRITPILMTYAEKKSKTLANSLITQAVNNEIISEIEKEKLFIERKDKNGNVISTDFDSGMVNQILNEISSYVETYIEELETGKIKKLKLSRNLKETYGIKNTKNGIVYEIPSGVIFGNALLSNLGPKIPVRINLNGDVVTNIKTEVTDYGINNALIKVSVTVKVYMNVIIPFKTKEIVVESDIPIVMRLIKGEVPSYYYPTTK